MPTQHLHRLLFVIPAASQPAFNTWFSNNLAEGGNAFTVGLNATGLVTDPITHYWNCRAYTNAELKLIFTRLCVLSSITLPANFDTLTRAQKKAWLISVLPTIKTATGIKAILFDDNDGVWSNYGGALTTAGLKTIKAPVGTLSVLTRLSVASQRRAKHTVSAAYAYRYYVLAALIALTLFLLAFYAFYGGH